MKIGYCTMNHSDLSVEEVCKLVSKLGYDAVELPAYTGNGQTDVDELLKGGNAKKLKEMVESYGLFISGLSNHADSPLIMGPYSRGMDSICPGTREEKIKFGQESMIKAGRLAAELGLKHVVAFSGMENYGHINDWPEADGWKYEEEQFAEKWGYVFDEYKKLGVKVAFEAHPNNVVYDIHSTLRLLEVAGYHESFMLNFDPANVYFSGIDVYCFAQVLCDRIATVHAKDCEIIQHNLPMGGLNMYMQDRFVRKDRSFRFRIPGWGDINWKKLISLLYLGGYDGVYNYEDEDVIMSIADGDKKTIEYLRPLMIDAPYEGRSDKLFTK